LVNGAAQTITFANPGTQTYGAPLTLSASASSGLPVSLASSTPLVCAVSGNIVTFVKTGTCAIEAKQLGDSTYSSALPVGQIFSVIGRTHQTIAFPAIPAQLVGPTITLSATASSGLPVSFNSMTPAVCSVSGNIVSGFTATMKVAGLCGIWAAQSGNNVFSAAPGAGHDFAVFGDAQTITFPAIPSTPLSAGSITLTATASSGLPVTYVSTSQSVCTVCTITASKANLLAAGTCGIEAKQLGNATYAPAPPLGRIFTVTAQ
jgi:hypothetical protein